MTAEPGDCTPCKLVGGIGFMGIGCYIGIVASKNYSNPYSRIAIALIGVGFAGIGLARLLGLPPFSNKKRASDKGVQ